MKKIIQKLVLHRENLLSIQKVSGRSLARKKYAFNGGLVHFKKNNSTQYFYRYKDPDSDERKQIYIKSKTQARILAEKPYLKKVHKVSSQQISVIDNFLESFNPHAIEQVYENLHPTRQDLIVPFIKPWDQYSKDWEEESYEQNTFPIYKPHYTDKGDIVRSKSEQAISNFLYSRGIPYRYEPVLYMDGMRKYPDFVLLHPKTRKEIYWEHFGIMDQFDYQETTTKKINDYTKAGFYCNQNIIYTFESLSFPTDMKAVESILQNMEFI